MSIEGEKPVSGGVAFLWHVLAESCILTFDLLCNLTTMAQVRKSSRLLRDA